MRTHKQTYVAETINQAETLQACTAERGTFGSTYFACCGSTERRNEKHPWTTAQAAVSPLTAHLESLRAHSENAGVAEAKFLSKLTKK